MLNLVLTQVCFTGSAGAGFTPHVLFVKTGEVWLILILIYQLFISVWMLHYVICCALFS